MVVMLRYWAFAVFVTMLAARTPGGIRAAIHTRYPVLQIARGLILILEICLMIVAFVKLGSIETHAVFTAYPLLIAALSGPIWVKRSAGGAGRRLASALSGC